MGNLPGGVALGKKRQDFLLPVRQSVLWMLDAAAPDGMNP